MSPQHNLISTIFSTKNNELAIFGQTLTDVRNKLIDFNDVIMQGSSLGSKSNKPQLITDNNLYKELSRENASEMDDYLTYLDGKGRGYIKNYVKENQNQIYVTDDVIEASKNARKAQLDHNEAVKQSTLSYKAGQVALKGLALAGNMLLSWGISKVIEIVSGKITELANATEIAEEKAAGFAQSVNDAVADMSSNTSTLSSLNDEYKELAKGVDAAGKNVSLSTDEYNRYKEIISQISDIMPDMTTYFNAQGEKIGFVKGNLSDLNKEYEKYIQSQAQEFLVNGDEDGNTFQDALDSFALNGKMGFWENWKNTWKTMFGSDDLTNVPVETMLSTFESLQNKSKEEMIDFFKLNSKDAVSKFLNYDGYLNDAENRAKQIAMNSLGVSVDELEKMSDEEFNTLQQSIINNIESLQNNIKVDMSSITSGLIQAAYSKDDFWAIEDAGVRDDIVGVLSSIDADVWKTLGLDTQIEVENYVGKIISAFSENKDGIADAWNNLFALDIDSIPANEYIAQVNSFIDTIAKFLGLDEEATRLFKISIGFDVDIDQATIDGLKERFDDVGDSWVDTLTSTELDLVRSDAFDKELEKQRESLDGAALSANDYEAALQRVKDAQIKDSDQSGYTPFSLTSEQSQALDDYQSKIKSIQSVYQELDTISPDSLIDLQQTFSDYDWNPYLNGTKSLETVLRELADTAEATALDSVPLLKEQISAIKDTAFETTEAISNMADALSDLSSKEELRTSLKDILNTVDEIDVDTLQKIAKAYPQLEKEIGGYMAGVVSIKELYESLDDAYQQDLEAYALYVAQKNGNDETYYTSLITSLSDELKDKAKFYDIDLDNYKTYIEAKMAMEAKLLEAKQKSSLAKQKLENLYTQDGEDRNEVRNIEYENSVYGKIVKKSEKTASEIQEIIDEFYKGVTLQFNLEEISGFGSSSSSSSTKDYEESIDWAEQSIEVLERAVSDLNTTLDNTSGYEEQIKVIDTLIKAQEALKNGYESSAKQYKEKYNSELDQLPSSVRSAYQSKIESGEEFSIEDFVQKNVTSGDEGSKEKLKNQLDTIMDYYDKWQEANQNLAQTEQDLIESERQKLEVQLEQIEAKRENLNLEKELAVTAADKNAILKEDLKLAEEEATLRATLAETIEESTKVQLEHQQEKLDNQEEQNKNLQDEVNIVLDIISAQQESAGTLVEKNKLIDEEIAKRYELLQLELALAETEEERLLLQSQYNNFLQESAQGKQNNTIDAYDNQASILENQIQQIQNRIDLAETLNEQGTEQQYRDMIALSEKTASIYSQKKAYLEGLLSSTQYGSDRFYELQSAITECDEAIITAKQNQIEWNVAILQIPIKQIEKTIESLEKLKEEQEEQLGQYDQVVSAVVKVIEDQNKALEQQKELEEEIWDTKIKPLQDELDYLQKINEARKTQLSIEEALYNLNKAKNEKTLRIRKNGQVEYVADEEAIREAQQSYDDAVYNKKIQDLENQIDDLETQKEEALAKYDEEMEALDEYKEKWTEVANIFEDMSNHTIAATKLGVDFATNVIGRNLDMLNQFSQQYVELEGHIDSTQQQIEANETLLVSIQDIVDAYLAEQYTALEAETAIHDAIVSNGDELNAIGQLSDAYSDLTNGMLLADEKVKSTIGNNEVIMNALAELIAKYKETKEEIVKSVDEICLAYEKQLEASTNLKVSEDTLWQDRINNLNQVMEEFELIMDRSVTLVINDSRKMVSEVASAVQSAATSMSKLSSQLSSAKSMAQEISDLANLNSAPTSSETKVSGGGIKDIHTVKDIYHDGMENGFVGENLSGSSAQDSFRLLALKKLKPDELPSILQLKEAVLNEEQQKNVLMNMRQALVMNSRMDLPNNVNSRNVASPNLTIGIENINLPNVNDAEQFVKALQTRLKSVSQQALYQNTNRRV